MDNGTVYECSIYRRKDTIGQVYKGYRGKVLGKVLINVQKSSKDP